MTADRPDGAPPLPELREAVLDPEVLDHLFADLEACTRVLEVRVKGAPDRYADRTTVDLRTARELLRAGAVRGAQVTYAYEGVEWTDTLLVGPGGVRLVRIRHGAADGISGCS